MTNSLLFYATLGLSIQRQCELIDLPRSSYYREGTTEQERPENIKIMRIIDKEYTDHPFYGTRQMRSSLKKYCVFYNHETPHQSFDGKTPAEVYYVENHMKLAG